jgi:hypothetical protein
MFDSSVDFAVMTSAAFVAGLLIAAMISLAGSSIRRAVRARRRAAWQAVFGPRKERAA